MADRWVHTHGGDYTHEHDGGYLPHNHLGVDPEPEVSAAVEAAADEPVAVEHAEEEVTRPPEEVVADVSKAAFDALALQSIAHEAGHVAETQEEEATERVEAAERADSAEAQHPEEAATILEDVPEEAADDAEHAGAVAVAPPAREEAKGGAGEEKRKRSAFRARHERRR